MDPVSDPSAPSRRTDESAGAGPDGPLRPVGPSLPGWTARPGLVPLTLEGQHVRLEPLSLDHVAALYDATCGPDRDEAWTYLLDEPPGSMTDFTAYVERRVAQPGLVSLALVPLTGPSAGRPAGLASWMRVEPTHGVAEVGSILFGPALQRTTAATEAMYLMADHVFGLGYRRYEWKCDALNAPSRAAALRLGFTFEGVFRNAVVLKQRSRDTAWFSITDSEWIRLRSAYRRWLAPDNFAEPTTGTGQRRPLGELTTAVDRG